MTDLARYLSQMAIPVLAGAAFALMTSAGAHADPELTYREQQWVDKNGHAICEELAKDPTQSGMLGLLSSMVNYYEMGPSSGNYIKGAVAQQCPQYRNLVPALSGGRN